MSTAQADLDSTSWTAKRHPKIVWLASRFFISLPFLLLGALLLMAVVSRAEFIDAVLIKLLGVDPSTWAYTDLFYTLVLLVTGLIVVLFAAIFGGVSAWYERRIAGRMQSRIGPNRAGAGGFLVWLADATKLLLKEDLIPADADALLFRAAPYFSLVGLVLTFVALPFGEAVIMADLNVGVFYVTSITALVVVGIMVSGWASNSKWALFGAIRGAAQVISYEIPAGLAIMVPVMMAGTLSMQGIVRAQGALPWDWFVFRNPAALVAFIVAFTAQLAEGNRTPFDLPEAESELVAGYHAEYSGFRVALFLMVEWANLWVMSAVAVTLFLGGWQVPFIPVEKFAELRGDGLFPGGWWWGAEALSMVVFAAKTVILVNVIIWLRWTLPRIRVDQMMSICWKYLVPAAFAAFLFTLLWQILVPHAAERWVGGVMTLGALVLTVKFVMQTLRNIKLVKGEKVSLENW